MECELAAALNPSAPPCKSLTSAGYIFAIAPARPCSLPPRAQRCSLVFAVLLALGGVAAANGTSVIPPPNMFTPEQDAELGREAAAVVRARLPLVQDAHVDRF